LSVNDNDGKKYARYLNSNTSILLSAIAWMLQVPASHHPILLSICAEAEQE
jgi:hypothetical protein